ncbi:MAG: hypothetical protein AB7F08_08690 [Dongiaceae bacterium]
MLIGGRKPLTAAQQFVNLRGNPICRGDGVLRAGWFSWCYSATPSALSREYDIRIEFRQGGRPKIFADGPDLQRLANGRHIPHLYQQKPPRLCLYLPKTYEWRSWMRLDQTVVPWAALWLFYFEEWLASDDWKGGGMHPMEDEDYDRGGPA